MNRPRTDNNDIDEGLMGLTIRDKKKYCLFNDVIGHPNYLEGNKKTVSELVVVIPNSFAENVDRPFGLINFESSANIFTELDGQMLYNIALRIGYKISLKEQSNLQLDILRKKAKSLNLVVQENKRQDKERQVYHTFANMLRKLINYDAITIISRAEGQQSVERSNIHYYEGFENISRLKKITQDEDSYSRYILDNQARIAIRKDQNGLFHQLNLSELYVHEYTLRSYRPQTSFAIGMGCSYFLVINDTEISHCSIIMEFDNYRQISKSKEKILKQMVGLLGATLQHIVLFEEHRHLDVAVRSVIDMLEIGQLADVDIRFLLDHSIKIIKNSIHSTGCGFYEVFEDSKGNYFLRELEFRSNSGPNVFWFNEFKKLITEDGMMRKIEKKKEYSAQREIITQDQIKRKYSLFVKKISLHHENNLFITFKEIESRHNDNLSFSKVTRSILNMQLSFLEQIISKMLIQVSRHAGLDAFRSSFRLLLQRQIGDFEKESPSKIEEYCINFVHEFLHNTKLTSQAPYSAVFLKKENKLEMTDTSFTYCKRQAKDGSKLHGPLKFDLTKSNVSQGLTQRVWSRGSIVSFNLEVDGLSECRDFWRAVTGTDSSGRYFIGVPIKAAEVKLGVITVNSIWTLGISNLIEGHKVQYILEVIGEELGQVLHELSKANSKS
ncbi:MAG: hypothetical protein AAFV95_20660 [Bacteroidota bacterium]